MRIHNASTSINRAVGRSYNSISSVSSLVRAHYELILNRTMVIYTRHIEFLTIIIAILTLITMGFTFVQLFVK